MTSSSRMPASGQPSMTRGTSPQASVRRQPDRLQPPPDLGHVLDADPVVLHVLPVGDVGDVAAELGADAADDPQRVAGQLPAVDADPHHEVGVLELLGLQQGGLAAGDALGALGVEAHPAHPAAQVAGVDAVEAGLRVDVEDPLTDLEAVGVLLHPLVRVERLPVAERPLALAALRAGARAGGGHGRTSSCARHPRGAGRSGGALQIGGAAGLRGRTGVSAERDRRRWRRAPGRRADARRAGCRGPSRSPWSHTARRSRPASDRWNGSLRHGGADAATDSSSGVTDVSTTTSARAGGS